MTVVGVDFDTRALHLVFLDDDTNAARYVPVPFVEHKPPFELGDARNVRPRLQEAIARQADGWDGVYLLGIEKPFASRPDNAWKYGLVVGAVLACVPRRVCVLELPPGEWRQLCGLKANASKDDVRFWAYGELWPIGPLARQQREIDGWPQDAFDAYCLARAARALNAKGIAA